MADRDDEARLRDLKQRVEREPRSRFFVSLAEAYRKAGRLPDAIRVLEEGLALHPAYVAARVALARAFLEAGRIEESTAAFSKVLADDPSNLVASKALGDIHLSRGERTEALKRYLRFRAISGDRRFDDVIATLREEAGPSPGRAASPPPPPPAPVEAAPAPLPVSPPAPVDLWPAPPARRDTDPFDITSVPYAPAAAAEPSTAEASEPVLSRDAPLGAVRSLSDDAEIVTRKIRLPESSWPFEAATTAPPAPPAPPAEDRDATPRAAETAPSEPLAVEPGGRALAELYLEQGHYPEAGRLSEELLAASPGDAALERVRDEAVRRLASSPAPAGLPTPDAARERRLAKIRILNQWLDAIEARRRP